VTDRGAIDAIIEEAVVCRLGMVSEGEPYVVPISFGYDGEAVYLHCAREGRKVAPLLAGQRICLEWDAPGELVRGEQACSFSQRYRSVIAWGTPEVLRDPQEQARALDLLLEHYAGEPPAEGWQYPSAVLDSLYLVRIPLEGVTGKANL